MVFSMASGDRRREITPFHQMSESDETESDYAESDESEFDSVTVLQTVGCSAGSTKTRGVRGKTMNRSLFLYLASSNGKKPKVDIPEGLLKPVGNWSKEFTAEVGIICRSHAPFTCAKWKLVTEEDKQKIYKKILEKFDINLECSRIRFAVDKYLGDRFRSHKHKLHKHYRKFKSHKEALKHPYENVSKEDWKVCCKQFASDKYKKVSVANTNNRGKVKVTHCAGSRSFARLKHESLVGNIEFWKKTHYRGEDKGWTNPLAQQLHEQMTSLQSQLTSMTEEEICAEVLGQTLGYERGLRDGKMVSASKHVGVSRTEEANQRAIEAEKRASDLAKQLEDYQTELHVTKSQLYVTQSMVEEMKSRQDQMETLMQSMMAHCANSTRPW
ncbi:hypothetical protein Scep_022262 [Stephania cephalantha]|uniref:Transposase, Ptta/En/Spm, plant n=1 Tax=Stephania cephalantha TaxID=152367 RepID=A0AAP0HXL2_9MAGN